MFAESTPKCQQNRRLLRICGDHEVWPTWRQNSFAHDQRSYSRRWHQSASHKWSTSVRSNLAKCRIATTAGNFIDFFNKNQSATDRLTHGKDTCIFQYRYRWRAIKPAGSVKMYSPYCNSALGAGECPRAATTTGITDRVSSWSFLT